MLVRSFLHTRLLREELWVCAKDHNRIASPITTPDRRCWGRRVNSRNQPPWHPGAAQHWWASSPPHRVASTGAGAPASSRRGNRSKSLRGTAELGGFQEHRWPGDSDEWNELVLGVQFLGRGHSEGRPISSWFCSGVTYHRRKSPWDRAEGNHKALPTSAESGWKTGVKTRDTVREKDLRVEMGLIYAWPSSLWSSSTVTPAGARSPGGRQERWLMMKQPTYHPNLGTSCACTSEKVHCSAQTASHDHRTTSNHGAIGSTAYFWGLLREYKIMYVRARSSQWATPQPSRLSKRKELLENGLGFSLFCLNVLTT